MGTINDVYSKWEKENEAWTHIGEDPRSLKSCLRKFGFVHLLHDLDDNLEAVRRHRISEDAHKEMIKEFDKKLLKLSLSYHPDHVVGAAGLMEAHNDQATINAIRTLITRLSEDFLRDIDIDYRYEYYAYIDISSIGNEEDVDRLNLNLQYQLIMLSEIKHEKIIANIKKFLMSSEGSLDSYYKDDRRNFVLNFNLAFTRLKECILGYKSLTIEFSNVEKQCAKDHNLQNTLWTVKRMSADFEIQLKILEKIKDVAKQSLKGNFQFYAENEIMDSYFVLPFAKYINVLSMCNVMLGNTERSWLKNYKKNLDFSKLDGNDKERKYRKAYYLALYFDNPNSSNENAVHEILNNNFHGDTLISSCKYNFDSILQNIREDLKKDFNVEKHYIVRSVKKRTEEYNREVQDFFEVMLRRKKSNMLALIDGQEKSRIEGQGNAMLLSQRIKYEKNISKLYTRKGAPNNDFKELIEGEKYLLKKIRDNFKERGEALKTKLLQSEITNEKLREELDVNKKEERELLEKLGKFRSQSNVKLIDEILEREEENRKLSDEIQMKREEERYLILILCGKYEKISSMFQEKINEIEKEELEKESRSSENSVKETGYHEIKNNFQDLNVGKSLRDEGNKNIMLEMDKIKNSRQSTEHQTSETEFEIESIGGIVKLSSAAAKQKVETEENNIKTLENETENQKTTKDTLLSELNNQLAIRASDKENADLKIVGNDVRNTKLVQESVKENESFKTSGRIDKHISLHEHKREDHVKYQPKIDEIDKQNTVFKISNNATENKDVNEFERTCNFEENSRLKEVSRDELTKRKYLTSVEIEEKEVKLENHIKNKLMLQRYVEEKALEIDMENNRSFETFETFETEKEKGRVVIEALRNLNQNLKLKYSHELETNVDDKTETKILESKQ